MGVVLRKKDGAWYVFVNHMGLRKAKRIGTDRKAAEQVKRVLDAKLALGDLGILRGEEGSVPTFESYAKKWLEQYAGLECKRSTQRGYEQQLRLHVTPRFGAKKLTEITRESVKQFARDLSCQKKIDKKTGAEKPKFSRNSLRLILGALRGVLNGAIEDRLIQVNPAAKVGRFAKSDKPAREATAMTRREVEQFLEAVQEVCPDWHPFFLTAVRAGLRRGELVALKFGHIHFGANEESADRYIWVQDNWVCDELTTPKSRKSRRVDMSRQLRRVLLDLYTHRLAEAKAEGRTSIADDLVFPSGRHSPEARQHRRALHAAGADQGRPEAFHAA